MLVNSEQARAALPPFKFEQISKLAPLSAVLEAVEYCASIWRRIGHQLVAFGAKGVNLFQSDEEARILVELVDLMDPILEIINEMKKVENKSKLLRYLEDLEKELVDLDDSRQDKRLRAFSMTVLEKMRPVVQELKEMISIHWIEFLDIRSNYSGGKEDVLEERFKSASKQVYESLATAGGEEAESPAKRTQTYNEFKRFIDDADLFQENEKLSVIFQNTDLRRKASEGWWRLEMHRHR